MKKTFLLVLFFTLRLCADTLYVDSALSSDCSGNYSRSGRNCTGSDGDAYISLHDGLANANVGDTLYIRSGTYNTGSGATFEIGAEDTGTGWGHGEHLMIASYPGEWAILDGNREAENGVVIGRWAWRGNYLKFVRFERLEITGGGQNPGSYCGGIWANRGPIWVDRCYIHDNLATTYTNNPGGITGSCWRHSIIEYCYFYNNGSDGDVSHNCSHINIYSDYGTAADPSAPQNIVADSGYALCVANGHSYDDGGTIANIIRYNLFDDGYVGFKHKGNQLLASRHPTADTSAMDSSFNDAYADSGDVISYNIFRNLVDAAEICQDYAQFHHNIIDRTRIAIQYAPDNVPMYKTNIYNNSFRNTETYAIVFYGSPQIEHNYAPNYYYGNCINNLVEGGTGSSPYGVHDIINFLPYQSTYSPTEYNYKYFSGNRNVFCNPTGELIRMYDVSYTQETYNQQTLTISGDSAFAATPEAVFIDTSAADKNKYISVNNTISGALTVSNIGAGGEYPSYSGATTPGAANYWVDMVLSLSTLGAAWSFPDTAASNQIEVKIWLKQ